MLGFNTLITRIWYSVAGGGSGQIREKILVSSFRKFLSRTEGRRRGWPPRVPFARLGRLE